MTSFNTLISATTPPPLPPRKRDGENLSILSRVPVAFQIFNNINNRLELYTKFSKKTQKLKNKVEIRLFELKNAKKELKNRKEHDQSQLRLVSITVLSLQSLLTENKNKLSLEEISESETQIRLAKTQLRDLKTWTETEVKDIEAEIEKIETSISDCLDAQNANIKSLWLCENGLLEAKTQKVKLLSQASNIEEKYLTFENTKQQLLGNFSCLLPEVINRILSSLTIEIDGNKTSPLPGEIDKCINIMKMFGKAQLGEKNIMGTIDYKIFAEWMIKQRVAINWLNYWEDSMYDFEYLKITNPNIGSSVFDYECFEYFDNLKTLILKDSSEEAFQNVRKLTKLTSVHLSNFYYSAPMDFTIFENCKNLKSLKVDWPDYPQSDKMWEGIASLHQLEEFTTNPSIYGLKYIPQLYNLKKLTLVIFRGSSDEINQYVGKLTKLEDLCICDWVPKGEEFLTIFGGLSHLKKLTFKNLFLTHEDMTFIGKSANKEMLKFLDCPSIPEVKGLRIPLLVKEKMNSKLNSA